MTTIQIEVDDDVLRVAELVARNDGQSLSEYLLEQIEHLANLNDIPDKRAKVETIEDLYEALALSREQYKNGQTITYEEFKAKMDQKRGLINV